MQFLSLEHAPNVSILEHHTSVFPGANMDAEWSARNPMPGGISGASKGLNGGIEEWDLECDESLRLDGFFSGRSPLTESRYFDKYIFKGSTYLSNPRVLIALRCQK